MNPRSASPPTERKEKKEEIILPESFISLRKSLSLKKESRGSLSFIKSKNDDLKLSVNKDNKILNFDNSDPVPVRESISKKKTPRSSLNEPIINAIFQDIKIPDTSDNYNNNNDNERNDNNNDVRSVERENGNSPSKLDFVNVTKIEGNIVHEGEVRTPSKSPKKDKNKNNPKAFTTADRELLDRIRAQEFKGGLVEKRLNRYFT